MKYFFTFLFLWFFLNQTFSQNCHGSVIGPVDAVGLNEVYTIQLNAEWGYSVTFSISENGIYLAPITCTGSTRFVNFSKNVPGNYVYWILPQDGCGINYYKYTVSVLKTATTSYSVLSNSILKPSNGHLFFVNSLGELSKTDQSSNEWYDAPLNINAPKIKSGTRFTEETSNGLFYVGTDQKIYALQNTGSTWNYYCIHPSLYANAYSDLEVSGDGFFYVDQIGNISISYKDGTFWQFGPLNSIAPKIKSGTGMSRETSNGIYYISENNELVSLKWNNGWSYTSLRTQINGRSDTDIKLGVSDYSVFWIGSDNKIYITYLDGTNWINTVVNDNAPTVKYGSDFYVDSSNDNIYYISANDNMIYKLYWNGTWQYEKAVDRQLSATGGMTFNNGNLFFTRSNDNKIYFYNNSVLKSGEIEPAVSSEVKIKIFPNPTEGRVYIRFEEVEQKCTKIKVTNINGQLILSNNDFKGGYVDISGNPPGFYFMTVEYGNVRKIEKIILK